MMNGWLELISYISFLIMVLVISLFIPFFADEIYQQFKAKKLAKKIADNNIFQKYDIELLHILLKAERIDSKYLKFLIGQILSYIHNNLEDDEKLKYFKRIYSEYDSNEIYSDISQPISEQIKALKKILDESQQTVLLNLANNIKLLETKSKFNKKLNTALTLISISVTVGSLLYQYLTN